MTTSLTSHASTAGKVLFAAAIGLALAFTLAPRAEAATIAELEARIAMLRAQIAAMTGGTVSSFTRDLTIGSTGAEVTTLQSWLIGRGFSIPAGATGYFGEQTRTALAAYQREEGITPPAGYFGVVTRGRVNSVTQGPAPMPMPDEDDDDEDDNNNDSDRDDADEAIEDLDSAIRDAEDEIDEADDDNADQDDIDDANDLLDEARDLLDDAERAFADDDFDEAVDLADEGMDKVDEALDEIPGGGSNSGNVQTSAEAHSVNGAGNDYATFEIEIEIEAFGDDMYIPQDADDAFTYEIQDGDGDEVAGGSRSEVISSSAEEEGDSYLIEEGDTEEFTFRVTFDPSSSGNDYRMQLLTVIFDDEEGGTDEEWNATPASKYRTDFVFIAD